MVVTAAGGHKVQSGGQISERAPVSWIVLGMRHLDPGQSGFGQLRDQVIGARQPRAPASGWASTQTPPAARTSLIACTGSRAYLAT